MVCYFGPVIRRVLTRGGGGRGGIPEVLIARDESESVIVISIGRTSHVSNCSHILSLVDVVH